MAMGPTNAGSLAEPVQFPAKASPAAWDTIGALLCVSLLLGLGILSMAAVSHLPLGLVADLMEGRFMGP
jgi:hypothetical protein